MSVALAGQDAPSTGGNAAATQTSPSTLVARLATVWRAYADGRIEQFPYSFPERGAEYSHYGSTYPLPSNDQRHIAFVRDNDLWLLDVGTGSVTQTTHLGRPYTAGQASVYVLVTAWSSDSRRLLYYVMDGPTMDGPIETVPELEVPAVEYG
ncbi:MAG: DPP IV N-terminal domain-containing protein, partial [Gemmatimonadetes bacterium]|nr:DPP IV N-terminal domain-containing protein [Gemmatimonadota bacterium]